MQSGLRPECGPSSSLAGRCVVADHNSARCVQRATVNRGSAFAQGWRQPASAVHGYRLALRVPQSRSPPVACQDPRRQVSVGNTYCHYCRERQGSQALFVAPGVRACCRGENPGRERSWARAKSRATERVLGRPVSYRHRAGARMAGPQLRSPFLSAAYQRLGGWKYQVYCTQ